LSLLLQFIISLVGCIGAWRVSKCLLASYIIVVILILLAMLAIAIAAYVNPTFVEGQLMEQWANATNETRNLIETDFKCCGFNSTTDHPYANGTLVCPVNSTACLDLFLGKYRDPLAGVGLTIVVIMLFAILFSIILACKGEK